MFLNGICGSFEVHFICQNFPFLNHTADTSATQRSNLRYTIIFKRTRSILHFGNSKVLITTHSSFLISHIPSSNSSQ
ncbi:hypothetical protein VNO78_21241 [Psophocarpus tetragonolobus]|uniref:Uncharacterized protein n=1 Tax=Psophocarpus tetragonolobus TaxID=3891 RepID=A0AAN9SEW4_PSOTE